MVDPLLLPGRDAIEVGANICAHNDPLARKLAAQGRRLLMISLLEFMQLLAALVPRRRLPARRPASCP